MVPPVYSWTRVKVGLVTEAVSMPRAAARPLVKWVFPAPRSPDEGEDVTGLRLCTDGSGVGDEFGFGIEDVGRGGHEGSGWVGARGRLGLRVGLGVRLGIWVPGGEAGDPTGDVFAVGFVGCPVAFEEGGFFEEGEVEGISGGEKGGPGGEGPGAEDQGCGDENHDDAGQHGVAEVAVGAVDDEIFWRIPGGGGALTKVKEEGAGGQSEGGAGDEDADAHPEYDGGGRGERCGEWGFGRKPEDEGGDEDEGGSGEDDDGDDPAGKHDAVAASGGWVLLGIDGDECGAGKVLDEIDTKLVVFAAGVGGAGEDGDGAMDGCAQGADLWVDGSGDGGDGGFDEITGADAEDAAGPFGGGTGTEGGEEVWEVRGRDFCECADDRGGEFV